MVFRYRMSRGEYPVARRKQAEAGGSSDKQVVEGWESAFFKPAAGNSRTALTKMQRENARGIFVVPFWSDTSFTLRLRRLADALATPEPKPGRPLVAGAQTGTKTCSLLLTEFGLVDTPKAMPKEVTVVAERVVQAWMREKKEKKRIREMKGHRKARIRETKPRRHGSL